MVAPVGVTRRKAKESVPGVEGVGVAVVEEVGTIVMVVVEVEVVVGAGVVVVPIHWKTSGLQVVPLTDH